MMRGVATSYGGLPLRDESFYELLVLFDALRDGRARERRIAEAELRQRLRAMRLRVTAARSGSR